MVIAERLKALREQKNLSQGDIEKRTGLLRCYISRVENGHTVPALKPKLSAKGWGSSGRDARTLDKFRRLFGQTDEANVNLLLFMAPKMSQNEGGTRRK